MFLNGFGWFLCFGCFVVLYLFLFGVSAQCQDSFLFGSLPSLPCSVYSVLGVYQVCGQGIQGIQGMKVYVYT